MRFKIWFFIVLLIICAMLLHGCTQQRSVVKQERNVDTLYINKYSADTLRYFNRDSIFVNIRGDTITIEKHYNTIIEKIKLKTDTVYKFVERQVSEVKNSTKKNYMPMILHIAGGVLLIIILIILKNYKKWILHI